jgi:hypothetical protein
MAEVRMPARFRQQLLFRQSGRTADLVRNQTWADYDLQLLFKQVGLRLNNEAAKVSALK